MNIFTKFYKDWTTIVDFLWIAKFLASPNNFGTSSTLNGGSAVAYMIVCIYLGDAQMIMFL